MIGRAMAVAGTTGGVVEVVVSPTDMFLDLAVAVCRTATYPGTGRQSQRGRTRSCADHAGQQLAVTLDDARNRALKPAADALRTAMQKEPRSNRRSRL